MSSFPGRMKEYPTISLDRFDKENLHARAYFLSHCHKDHMKGLKGPLLKRKLKFSRTAKLYCSFVTRELLLNNPKYDFWDDRIIALELDSPTQVALIDEASGEREDIVVTLLPAGHCPGSVMFLIEGAQGTVLYTGDFRLAEGDVSRIELLHSGNRVKDIQSVYLDSTFYDPRFYKIPSRETCLNGIRKLVSDWIGRSAYHRVWLNCKAAYGYEYLFTNLGEEFNTQIHVNSLAMFKKMPEILTYVTTERATQIHACRHPTDEDFIRGNRLPCGSVAPDGTPLRIISIKPSTMWFGERSRKTNVIVRTGDSSYRACFSFHSSYSEINDFLAYLNPVNIYASVVPIGRTHAEVTEMLKPMCRDQTIVAELTYRPLGTLKRTRAVRPSQDVDDNDWLFDGTDLVPVRKKSVATTRADKPQSPPSTVPPGALEEHMPLSITVPHSTTRNYIDCTESNDEDEDEEYDKETQKEKDKEGTLIKEEKEEEETKEEGEKILEAGEENIKELVYESSPSPPRWDEFFTAEPLTDSQNSLTSQSHSCCPISPSHSGLTGSQTPELFGEDNDGDESSQSTNPSSQTSIGEHQSQADTILLENRRCRGDTDGVSRRQESDSDNLQSEPRDLTESQASSDFDIPCTPESQTPCPEQLKDLYKKLAAGEEVVIRKGSEVFQ
ncbi:protein artemis isoform X1 [Osmerus eperlanus]|uniref:protein artemis isoform X1 n=1 Tax=Osmerus eperlanus TaxID=29151 RepID=UPI002E12753A